MSWTETENLAGMYWHHSCVIEKHLFELIHNMVWMADNLLITFQVSWFLKEVFHFFGKAFIWFKYKCKKEEDFWEATKTMFSMYVLGRPSGFIPSSYPWSVYLLVPRVEEPVLCTRLIKAEIRTIKYKNSVNNSTQVPRVVKFLHIESRVVVARDWGRGRWGVIVLMGINFSFVRWKEFWKLVAQQCEST